MRCPEATYRRAPASRETASPTCLDLLVAALAFLLGMARRLKEDWWLGRASAAFLAYYVCMAGPWFTGQSVTFVVAYNSDAMGVSRSLTAAFMFLCFVLPMLAGHSMIARRHGCKAGILEALYCSAVSVYAAVGVLSVPEVLLHGTPWVGVCLSAILLVVAYFVLKKGGAYAAKLQLASGACRALVVLGVASAFLPAAGGLAERQIDYPDNMQDASLEANIEAIARFYDDSAWSAMTPLEREDALVVLRAAVLRKNDRRARGHAHKKAEQQVHKRTGRTHSRQRHRARVTPDNDRVHGIIHLLEKRTQQNREKENQQLFPDDALSNSVRLSVFLIHAAAPHFVFSIAHLPG